MYAVVVAAWRHGILVILHGAVGFASCTDTDTLHVQLWLRLGVMAYFLFCMVLLWLVRFGTCASAMFVDTGIMPMHVRLAKLV